MTNKERKKGEKIQKKRVSNTNHLSYTFTDGSNGQNFSIAVFC